MVVYSAKKRNTKVKDMCSVLNPLTSSDSASPKSKGVRIVSHKIIIIHKGINLIIKKRFKETMFSKKAQS